MRRSTRVFVGIGLGLTFTLGACGGNDGGGGDGGGGGDDGGGDGDGGGNGDGGEARCGELTAVLRDFKAAHPDFEATIAVDRGIVAAALGSDGKPVYASAGTTPTTSGAANFDQWYRDTADVNLHFEQPLILDEVAPGVFVFEDLEFFPLDGLGWPDEDIAGHNFHFTTEIHGTFRYRGGEVFTFTGDDDVFVFVNGQRALDLGGVHGPEAGTIDFDAQAGTLGIVTDGVYALDVFHAERHTSQSNFRIETSIDCLVVEVD